jgi:hypothetical protein
MHITEVMKSDARYSRHAYLKFVDDKVIFDCSDEEYGPIEFPIEELERALEKHRKSENHKTWLSRILKYNQVEHGK